MIKKGQISTEYLLTIAIVLLILIPAIVLYFVHSADTKHTANLGQAQESVNTIASAAENIYYLGQGSQSTVEVRIPENVEGFRANYDTAPNPSPIDEIYLTLYNPRSQLTIVSRKIDVPITLGTDDSGNRIDLPNSPGIHKLKLIAIGERVCITTLTGRCDMGTPPPNQGPNPGPTPTTPVPPQDDCTQWCKNNGYDSGSCGYSPSPSNTCVLDQCSNPTRAGLNIYSQGFGSCSDPLQFCNCLDLVCCSNNLCNAAGDACGSPNQPPPPPHIPQTSGVILCQGLSPVDCQYSDGYCPCKYGSGWSNVQKLDCVQLDPDCDTGDC